MLEPAPEKRRWDAARHVPRWCVWGSAASIVAVLITGFAGMAYKETCLPKASHCTGDLIHNTLLVLYSGALLVLLVCLLAGAILAVIPIVRSVSRLR